MPQACLAWVFWLLADQALPGRRYCRGAKRSAAGMACKGDPLEGKRSAQAASAVAAARITDQSRTAATRHEARGAARVKPAIQAVVESVANERFCMALAEMMGFRPAQAKVHSIWDRSFLLVERYDRVVDASGQRQRLHQEDFCQALGVVPEMKYQNEGGPDLAQYFELVRRATRPSAPQILRLFDGVVFNALIGNHDAHAKNFSLLYAGTRPILAPFCDMLSTAVYPMLTPKMAMKIGSKYEFSEVHAHHWDQFAESAGLSRAQSRRRILAVASSLPPTARKLQSVPARGFAANQVVDQIIALIEQRCALTLSRLNGAATDHATAANPCA